MSTSRLPPGDLNILHSRVITDVSMTFVLELDGRVEVERLDAALQALQCAFPVLSCVVAEQQSVAVRVPVPGYRLRVRDLRLEEPHGTLRRFLSQPVDPKSEPPLKAALLRDLMGDILAVKVDHVLSDAAGVCVLLEALAALYTSGNVPRPFRHDRGIGQILARFSLPALISALATARLPGPPPPLDGPRGTGTTFVELERLPPDRLDALRRYGRSHDATLTEIMLASLFRAVFRRVSSRAVGRRSLSYPVMLPVDMRQFLPMDRRNVVANLTSSVYPAICPVPHEPFPGTLRRVREAMAGLKRHQLGLGPLMLEGLAASFGGSRMRRRYSRLARGGRGYVCLSNVGVLPELVFGRVRPRAAYVVGPDRSWPGLLLCVSTYAGTLSVAAQTSGDTAYRLFVRELLHEVLNPVEVATDVWTEVGT